LRDTEKIAARTKEYEERFLSPFIAAERGYIDDVIMPQATRPRIARALAMLRGKTVEMPGRNAMPDGGQLSIETGNAYLDEAYCRQHSEIEPGQYA
jgi:hypothetical protein